MSNNINRGGSSHHFESLYTCQVVHNFRVVMLQRLGSHWRSADCVGLVLATDCVCRGLAGCVGWGFDVMWCCELFFPLSPLVLNWVSLGFFLDLITPVIIDRSGISLVVALGSSESIGDALIGFSWILSPQVMLKLRG